MPGQMSCCGKDLADCTCDGRSRSRERRERERKERADGAEDENTNKDLLAGIAKLLDEKLENKSKPITDKMEEMQKELQIFKRFVTKELEEVAKKVEAVQEDAKQSSKKVEKLEEEIQNMKIHGRGIAEVVKSERDLVAVIWFQFYVGTRV